MNLNHPDKTTAIRWYDIDVLRLDTIDVPELKDDYVLVRNFFTSICGTDRHSLHHGSFIDKTSGLNYPAILGHEASGEIVDIGKNVECDAVGQPITVGDMVAYHEVLSCGKCMFCRQGDRNICRDYMIAALKPGTLVQYYTYPRSQIIKVEGISAKHCAVIEPSSCALHGFRLADVKIGDTVVIIGGGCMGLLRLQFVRNSGATKIILVEPYEMKRKIAKDLGADIVVDPGKEDLEELLHEETYEGYGADVVFEEAGFPETQLMALKAARPRGTVLISGISESPVSFNLLDQIQMRELRVQGSIGVSGLVNRRHDYLIVADLIRAGRLKIDRIITHEFHLREYDKAFEMSEDSAQAIKVMVRIT